MLSQGERSVFLKMWLRNPRRVGSVAPSSGRLAEAMTDMVPWESVRTVVELGAGTGAVTEQILRQLPDDARLLAFERELGFRQLLNERFPAVPVFAEASTTAAVLRGAGMVGADAIISGIPFALLTAAEREVLLAEIDDALLPGGTFVAFQYSPQLYPALRKRFADVRLRWVLGNLPPAFVYGCRKGPA